VAVDVFVVVEVFGCWIDGILDNIRNLDNKLLVSLPASVDNEECLCSEVIISLINDKLFTAVEGNGGDDDEGFTTEEDVSNIMVAIG
jgi:hypothetical protein